MAFMIGAACIDVLDRSCVDQCPVDCIYEGSRKLYIQPDECIDCGACEMVCPVSAVTSLRVAQDEELEFGQDNADFFATVLPGRSEPLGSPGGAAELGPVGADTALVAARP
ncbi:ferredoxin [Nocardioides humi]|uniref:Ferredoxin n=1 Tax=Nocardioides humi TaxID=449461 RepID=A0ABN2ACW3_9ACTN|nr:ferredoxin [Nocardioides humi]